MVAIVTGNALGLSTSSLSILGQKGANGSAALGRNGDMAYVNAATGNLVLQTQDEMLVGRGLSIESLRTYNSRGLFNDDNGDNWSMGVYRQQLQRIESPPYSGVYKFVRTDRDGAQATYVNTYAGYYETKDGEGVPDRIYDNTATWTWVDGNTGLRETYEASTGRLMTVTDKSGNSLTYGYDGAGQLSSVTDANGEQTFYDYVGNQLRQVRIGITKNSQFVTQTRVRYEYESSYNRLWKVTVDLTPEVDGVADGKTFVTTYGYDGASKRVSSITHNNDTVLRLEYDSSGRVQYSYDAYSKRTEYRYEATGRTRVIDPLNAETVYEYFPTGDLKSVSSVAGGTVLQTVSYTYDTTNGDVTSVIDGQNNATTYSGYFSYERDALGNTVMRSYTVGNNVQWETHYFDPNPLTSYSGTGTYGTLAKTRYVYDDAGLGRLRFVISAEGRVTEYRYDAQGQRVARLTYNFTYPSYQVAQATIPTEAAMVDTCGPYGGYGNTEVQRTDMSYDARGLLKKVTAYTATDYLRNGVQDGSESVTQYVYDQAGRLLQTISPMGAITTMVYDGLGRVISRVEANGTTTLTTYNDASNIVEHTITQTGLKTTSVYDKAGRIVSVQQTNLAALGLGETKYAYDANGRLSMATDPTGVRHWMLYDEAGRKVADIDGNGTLIEYSYNRSGQLTRTATYSTAVNTAVLVDITGKPTAPALATLRPVLKATDVYQWNAYDKAGRLVKTINAEGAVTETFYDGADRVLKVTQYASRISTAGLGAVLAPESITPALDAARDRTIRYFYDTDGLLLGELDAEGYFTEYRYDAAGQRTWTLRYTTAVAASLRAAGSFYQFAPYNWASAPRSQTVSYCDNKGRVVVEIDAENYLTEFEYDKNGNITRRVRYSVAYKREVTASIRLADIKWELQSTYGAMPGNQVTTWQYDQSNRVTLMTEPDGTVTKYDYDAVGNLVRTTRAYGQGTEERALNARYDAQGRLVAELAASEAWRLTTGMTDAQVAAVFDQYGVKHSYDKAGRRTSTTDRNGLTTLYFYNEDSQLTHTVNAMGEVEERRYNALNQLEATLHYGLRLDSTTRSQLRSGTTSIASAVAAIADASKDARTSYAYKLSGLLASSTEQLKIGSQAVVQHLYDAFGGEIERRTDLGDGSGGVRVDTMGYDRRGLLTRSTEDSAGAAIDTTIEYDAFGRAIKSWDDAGKLTETGYDKLGRVIKTVDRHGYQRTTTTYDAFDRVLTQTDALGKVTTYTYNTAARSVEMLTPESVKVTTVSNRHGQTLSITDGKLQTTSYTYDKDGNLTRTTAPIASASTNQTFERGRLIEAFDANDTKVKYSYDDANRILSREVDPDGLKLLTKYEYDSSGRQVKVTDPAGVVTRFEYDLGGRQVAQTVDEGTGRLNLRTEYTHDASGHVLTVTSPGNRVTQYKYDALGRRTEEIVDPAGLKLRTVYTFDHDGNVRTRTDAKGAVSGFAYDEQGWLQYSVDGAGGVTYYEYDRNGRVTRTTRYATAISIAGLTAQFTSADIALRVVKTPGKDAVEARSYDGDGRLRFTADGTGAVVEYRYDKNNNVTDRVAYAKAINVAAWTTGNPPVVQDASDQRLRNEYDALNRLTYQADGTGAVTRREYDDNGNLRRLTEYATRLTGTQTPGQVAGSTSDRVTVYVYDKANRETLRIDAMGAVQKSEYDNDGNLIARTNYVGTVTPGTEPANITLNLQDRVERYVYDGAGRRIYSVDAMNFVTRWTYEDAQSRRTVTRFGTAISAGGNPANVALNAAADQTDVYLDDKAGRVLSHTDAEGKTESWEYDELGNKKSFTNKKGSVWQYEYDGASRLIRETSPEVYLTAVTASADGKLQQGDSADVALKTFMVYDALGNLLKRTEAENRPEQRTTSYEYDARGRQIKVTYPPVLLYEAAQEQSQTAQTFYDALGNAVANIDVAGRTSYKVYDLVGRVRYEVDTVGHVTGYERNTFGEAEKLTRYSVRTNLPAQTTASSVALMPSADALKVVDDTVKALDHSHDRSISTTYDKRGRAFEVREGTVYTLDSSWATSVLDAKKTTNTYNAFGELVKTRVSGLTDNAAIDTYFYYDRAGHQIAQVDAMGYLTVREFDATGNMTTSTEYAGKLDAGAWNADAFGLPLRSGDDRKTAWTYDRLNRKVSETRVGVSFASSASAIPAGQPAAGNITTRFGYDAVGNLTSTTDANGGKVLSYYDALGRVTAVASPATQDVNGLVTPLTVFLRDAYGNVAVKWDLANGATQAEEFTGVSKSSAPGFALVGDAARDRRTVTQYDRMGRAIKTTDAEEHTQTTAYRANGQVGETRQAVTDIDGLPGWIYQIFEYDELGRLKATREPAPSNVRGDAGGAQTLTQVSYNAFGEITERQVDGKVVEFFDYDDVGQLWRTNSGDGVTRVMFYDVHGRKVAEVRARGEDFGDVDLQKEFKSAAAVKDAVLANDQRLRYTLTQYDVLGRVVMQTQPVRTESQGGVVMKTHSGATATVLAPTSAFKNIVKLTWAAPDSTESLDSLGAGELRVDLTYTANVKSGSGQEATTELRTLTRSQVFGAEQSGKGVEFGWNDTAETLQEIQNFSVWKKDSAGVYRLILDRAIGAKTYSVEVALPPDPAASVRLETKAGNGNWIPQTSGIRFGSVLRFDLAQLGTSTFSYQVFYDRLDPGSGLVKSEPGATGQFTITGAPVLQPINILQGGYDVPGVAKGVLAWSKPPAGTTQVLNYRPIGGTWRTANVTELSSTLSSFNTTSLPDGDYDFELLWTPSGQTLPTSHATGIFKVIAAVAEQKTSGTPNITGIQVTDKAVSWNTKIGTIAIAGTARFEWRLATESVWQSITKITTADGISNVDISGFDEGAYQFRISYELNGALTALGTLNASLAEVKIEYAPPPDVSNQVTVPASGFSINPAGTVLSWVNTGAISNFEYRERAAEGQPVTNTWTVLPTTTVGSNGSVNISGLAGGKKYEFRITSELAGNATVTIGAGNLTTYVVGGGIPQPPQVSNTAAPRVTGLQVAGQELSWDAIAGTDVKVEGRYTGAYVWGPLPVSTTNGKSRVDMAGVNPGDYEVRISHYSGDNLVAFDARSVKVYPNPSAAPYFVNLTDGRAIKEFKLADGNLTWFRPAFAAPGTALFEYVDPTSADKTLRRREVVSNGATDSISMAGLPANCDFKVTYSEGSLVIGGGAASMQPGTPTAIVAVSIPDIGVSDGRLRWKAPADPLTTKVYMRVLGVFVEVANPELANGQYSVVLPKRTDGYQSIEYLIQYCDKTTQVVAVGAARVELSPSNVRADPVLFVPSDAGVANIKADRLAISWDARPGTFKFEGRVLGSGLQWEELRPVERAPGVTREYVSVAGFNGNFEWRITYTDPATGGAVSAIASGTLDISSPTPQLSNLNSGQVSGFTVAPGRIRWVRPADATGLSIKVLNPVSGVWDELPAEMVSIEGDLQVVDLSKINVGSNQVLISYFKGREVIQVMRGTVTTFAPGTATASDTAVAVFPPTTSDFSWTDIAGAGTPFFQYRLRGDNNASWRGDLAIGAPVDGKRHVNISGLDGSYEYRVTYTSGAVVTALATGQLDVVRPKPQLSAVDGAVLKNMTSTTTRWSWDRPAGSGTIKFRAPGGQWNAAVAVKSEGARDYYDVADAPVGTFEYAIAYTELDIETAFSTGVVVVNPPTLANADRADIQGLAQGPAGLSWTANTTPGTTAKFAYRGASDLLGEWTYLDVQTANGKASVDLTGLNGAYDYRISYELNDSNEAHRLVALDAGRINITTTAPTVPTQGASRLQGLTATASQLKWLSRAGTLKVEYRATGEAIVVVGDDYLLRNVGGYDVVDMSRFGKIGGDFRITYTDSAGLVTAMAIGDINGPGWASPSPSATANVTGFAVVDSKLVWTSTHTGTAQFFYRVNGGTWYPGPQPIGSSVDISSVLNTTAVYDYRVVYSDGAGMTALGMGRLTTTAASAALGTSAGGRVEGFQIDRRQVSWATPAGAVGAPVVFVRQAGYNWEGPMPLVGQNALDLSQLPVHGTWEVRVTYMNGGQPTHVGTASFTVDAPTVSSLTSADIQGITGVAGPRMIWNAMPGTPLLEYFDAGSNSWKSAAEPGAGIGTMVANDGTGHGSFNFLQIPPASYSFRLTYLVNGDTKGFAGGTITFAGGTAAPSVTHTTDSFFGASIVAGLGELRWTRPPAVTAGAFYGIGQYRVAGSGAGWTTLPVPVQQRTSDNHFLDISGVPQGNYEFRIVYAASAGTIAGAAFTMQVSAPPMPVRTDLASLGTFTLSGTQLSWTPPAAGGSPVFEYQSGGNWIAGPAIGTVNGRPSVDVAALSGKGTVSFRVRYTAGGYDVGFGSGSFVASVATHRNDVLASDVAGFRIEFGKLLWNRPATAVGSPTFSWRPSSGGGWQSVSANESFDLSALAAGSWSYRVTYTTGGVETSFGSGTITVPTGITLPITTRADIGPVTAPPNGTTLEWAPSVYPGAIATFKYSATGSNWQPKAVSQVNGKDSVSVRGLTSTQQFRIEYTLGDQIVGLVSGSFSVGSTGTPVLLNSTNGEVEGVGVVGTTMKWTRPASGGTAKVYVRRSGQTAWEEKGVNGETADLSGILNAQYEFRIEYSDATQVTAMAVGTLVPQSVQVTAAATTNVTGFKASLTRLSWDKPALTGVTDAFEYYDEQTGGLRFIPVIDDVGGRRAIDIAGLGNVRYRVVYRDIATGDIRALGAGVFTPAAQATPVLTPVVSTVVSAPELKAGRMVWERPASVPADSTVIFERKSAGGFWSSAGMVVTAQDAAHDRIELSTLTAGTYEWRVKYMAPLSSTVVAIGSGTLVVPPSVALSNQALGNVTGIKSDTRRLTWDPVDPSSGTPEAHVFNSATQGWDALKVLEDDVTHRPYIDVAGIVGTYEFRISYGVTVDGQRRVMAMARGTFTGTAGTASYTVKDSPVGDFKVIGNELSWVPASGSLEVHRLREGTTTWELISPVNSNGARHSLTIGDIEAGNYQYRVVYRESGSITGMARIGVTIDQGVAVARRPAEVLAATPPVIGFTVPAQTHEIRWTRNESGGTPVFEYRRQGSLDWIAAPVGSFDTQHGVDIRGLNLPQGKYEFRVQYRSGQGPSAQVKANGAGLFTVPAPLAGTQAPTLQLNTAPAVVGNFVATITSLKWNAPANSSGQRVLLEARIADETVWSPIDVTRDGPTDHVNFKRVINASAYEYRVTYTDGAGVVTALGSGVVKFGDATTSRLPATKDITTPPYVPGHPASDSDYRAALTTATHPNAISDPRLGFTAAMSGGAAPGAYALQPKITQKLDRWGNVIETTDPRNAQWKTTYKWNWANQLVEQVRPVDGALGASPTTRIYYDALGRQVGMQDANGNLNTKTYDLSGNLIEEEQGIHYVMGNLGPQKRADGGRTTYSYDALGNKVQTTDAVGNEAQRTDVGETVEQANARRAGRTTDFVYDRMGRLLKAIHGPVDVYSITIGPEQYSTLTLSAADRRRVTETFTYDAAGRRLTQTNGNNEITRYRYDAAGHVVETIQPMGTKTTTTYDAYGYKQSETDANGKTQRWVTDAYGRVTSHTDLSGVTVKYVYDMAGLLQTLQTVGDGNVHNVGGVSLPGQDQGFKYDEAGQLIEIIDKAVGRTTTYRYDAAGNHVLERTEQKVGGSTLRLQDNYMGYDAQGRLRQIFDGHLSIAIDYDLNGNRKKITTGISVLSAAGSGNEVVHDSVRNFNYDAMNRQMMVEEYDEQRIALRGGPQGIVQHQITYFLDGNRKTDSFFGNRQDSPPIVNAYEYDNLGRLVSATRDGTQVDLRRYDGAGRALQSGSPGNLSADYVKSINQAVPQSQQIGADQRFSAYDKNGRLLLQNVNGSDGKFKQATDYRANGAGLGYDAVGNLQGYRLNIAGSGFVETHRYEQAGFDGYVVATETVTDKDDKNPVKSRIEYDANGHQKQIVDEGKAANNRTIYSDTAGRALLVDQGGNMQRQLIVNGEVLGSYGIGLDDLKPKDDQKNPRFAPHVDFEWGYQQINGNYPGASPGAYTVRQGDTLQGIARGAYGDSRMWYRIAEANGLSSDSDLKVGQTLVIPTGVGGVHNASDTFQPYDPSKVVGDTSPTLPVPPAKKGCGGVGMIIMIVVAVVATIFTAGAAALAMAGTLGSAGLGTVMAAGASAMIGGGVVAGVGVSALGVSMGGIAAAAAIGGAVGSIVSQGVGIAIGAQEKFSWKQVGLSAIGSGVGAGIGGSSVGAEVSSFAGGGATGAMAVAAVSNAATQGIAVAVGVQEKFQWRSVAASAVGAGVGRALGGQLGNAWGGGPVGDLAARTVTGFVAGATAAAMRGGRISVQQIATDAFGNALGNAVVDAMSPQNTAQEKFRQSEINDQNLEAARYQGQGLFSGSRVRLGNSGSGRAWFGTGDDGNSAVEAAQQQREALAAMAAEDAGWVDQIRLSKDRDRAWANFEKEYGAYTAKQDSEAAARAKAERPLEHARADAYRKELLAKQAAAARASRIEVVDGAGASFNGPSFASGVNFDAASAFGSGQGTPSKMDQPGLLVRLLGGSSATELRRDISPLEKAQIAGTQRLSTNLTASAALVAVTGPLALEAGAAGGAYALTGAVNTGRALYYGSRALALDVAAFGPWAAYQMNANGINAAGLFSTELALGYDSVSPSALPAGAGRATRNIAASSGGIADDFVTFYHGTSPQNAPNIRLVGIDLSRSKPINDFGPGFYMTTSREEAILSATMMSKSTQEVVEFSVPRAELSRLNAKVFSGPDAEWADFVTMNRKLDTATYLPPDEWAGNVFDMVTGPMFGGVKRGGDLRTLPGRGNQISIHTNEAVDLFNRYMVGR